MTYCVSDKCSTTELYPYTKVEGLEPTTCGFGDHCSTIELHQYICYPCPPPVARLSYTTLRTEIISERVTLSLTLVLSSLLCWDSKNRTYIKWLTAIRSNR